MPIAKKYYDAQTQTKISGIIPRRVEISSYKDIDIVSLTFLWTLLFNCFTKQKRHNEVVYDLSMIIYLTSTKTYNLCREFFSMPAFQNLYEKYGKQIEEEKIILLILKELMKTLKILY